MDSSDDSFAWSDASVDSEDMDVNKKDETQESAINYKKTLQENSFKDEQQEPKKKSKKRKHEETGPINESEEEKPKHIKSEPESDFDAPKKKKKKKNQDDSNINESQQSNNSDENYLNCQVKQEQTSFAEPVPVKSKKKKKHKRDSEMATSDELDNHDHDISNEENHIENDVKEDIDSKKKKKKRKNDSNINESQQSDNSDDSYLNRLVKQEQTSFAEPAPVKSKKKKKHKRDSEMATSDELDNHDHDISNEENHIENDVKEDIDSKKKKKKRKNDSNINESQQSDNSDDSYLNRLVKQEQTSFAEPAPVKSKKKKRHKKDSEMATSDEIDNHVHDMSTEENHVENDVKEEIESNKKKNKKSKHEENTSTDVFEPSDDNFKAKKKLKKKKQENIINSTSYDKSEISQISQIEDISAIDSSTLVNNYLDDDQSKVNVDVNDISQEIESNTSPYPDTSSSNKIKKSHKIADRLRFEDEDSVDNTLKENVDDTKLSKNLKEFIESNSKYSIVKASSEKGTMLTPNDEIWMIKAPHDLNVRDFAGINMKIGGRNKLKINGQTYDLVSDDSIEKAPILKCDKNKIQLLHVPINSVINVHKRIPKAHIPEENVMVNHQPNFIPLPETKCRHPLFGVNYRKATKIAPSVAERLNETIVSSPVNDERVKKKKHRKEKRKLELESESETKPLDEEAMVISSKKKRKRKSSIKEEPVTKKAKYANTEDTGDVWESEQAIEKNLFDF